MEEGALKFSDRVLRLLERTEYRRADTGPDKEAIYRMRHAAYSRAGTVKTSASGLFSDHYDEMANVWLIGVYIDGELASSVRLHVSASLGAITPVQEAFPDVIRPLILDGKLIIDATRFSAKLAASQEFPEIPYLTLRPVFIAEAHFRADYVTAACLEEHQSFYRRAFSGVTWRSARVYPHFTRPMALVAFDCAALRQSTYERYPFYRSSETEQARLFSRSSNNAYDLMSAIGRDGAADATHGSDRPSGAEAQGDPWSAGTMLPAQDSITSDA
jgi:hypothetical protein